MFQLEFRFKNLDNVLNTLQKDFLNIDCRKLLKESWSVLQPQISEILENNFERIQSMVSRSKIATDKYFKIRGTKIGKKSEVGNGRIKVIVYDAPLMSTGTLKDAYTLNDPYSFTRFSGGKQDGAVVFGIDADKFRNSYPEEVQKWLIKKLGASFAGFYALPQGEQERIHAIVLSVIIEKLIGGENAS